MAALLSAGLVVAGAAVAPAVAAPRVVSDTFGASATTFPPPGGTFGWAGPKGVAVNHATGDVYVADPANNRIQRFAADGTFISAWGQDVDASVATIGTGFEVCTVAANCKDGTAWPATDNAGQLNSPQGVAVDQTTGAVWVTEAGNLRIQRFSAAGTFELAIGWGVNDSTPGDGLEVCTAADTCKDGIPGGGAGQFDYGGIGGPAVDPTTGSVSVADPGNFRIQRFSSTGAFEDAIGWGVDTGADALERCTSTCQAGAAGGGLGQFNYGDLTSLAVDAVSRIYTVDQGSGRVQRFDGLTPSVFAAETVSGSSPRQPLALAVDPVDGHVYVAKPALPAGGNATETRVLELDAGGMLIETHLGAGGPPAATGIAVDPYRGRLYLPTATGGQVLVLGSTPPPEATATMAPVTAVGATTATFSGTVDPNGYPTSYRFEYSSDGDSWSPAPAFDVPVGRGPDPAPVTQTVSNLNPRTDYRVRLVAMQAFQPDPVRTATAPFTTLAAPPTVGRPTAVRPVAGSTSVVVRGRVHPHNTPTTYRFEYGPTAAYGSQTPEASVASTGGPVTVTQRLQGLEPGTLYHLRLLATNDQGTSSSVDVRFTIPVGPGPDGRGYELVSPADSLAYDLEPQDPVTDGRPMFDGGRIAADSGDAIAFDLRVNGTLPGMLADLDRVDIGVARRSDDGWTTTVPFGDRTRFDVRGPTLSANGRRLLLVPEKASDVAEISPRGPSGAPLSQQPDRGRPSFDVPVDGGPARYLVGAFDATGAPVVRADDEPSNSFGGAPDLSTWYFLTSAALVPDAAASLTQLYRHGPDGTTLLSHTATGTPFQQTDGGDRVQPNAVGEDGRRVTFTAPAAGTMVAGDTNSVADVYQVRGSSVRWASRSEYGGPPQTARARTFAGASTDGRRVLFTTAERMVGDGTTTGDRDGSDDLYLSDEDAPAGQRLALVSAADSSCTGVCTPNADNTGPTDMSTIKPVGNSGDGSHVFFITGDVLHPDDTDAQQSLYVRDMDAKTTTYVAPAGAGVTTSSDGTDVATDYWSAGSLTHPYGTTRRPFRASVDGTMAAFLLATDVTLPVDRGGTDADGVRDLYVWREGDGLTRVRQGAAADANTATVPSLGCITAATLTEPALPACRAITDDGRRLYFQTDDALTDGDVNDATDVYEYDTADHEVRLLSSGDSTRDNLYVDNDLRGDNVFFRTAQTLDPSRDTDGGHIDLYDVRRGGGLPPLRHEDAACDPVQDRCQGPDGPTPGSATAGTVTFSGSGNVALPAEKQPAKVRVSKIKVVHGTSTRLKVRVPEKGKIRTSGSGLKRGHKTAKKAGTYRVTVKLSNRARRTLKRKHRVKVRVTVRFTPAKGKTQRVRVHATFKPKASKKKRTSSRSVRQATALSASRKGR